MEELEIRQRIREIIAQVTGLDASSIADDAHFKDSLDLDSLSLLEVAVEVDLKFGLGLPDEHFRSVATLGGMVQLVDERLAELAALPQAATG